MFRIPGLSILVLAATAASSAIPGRRATADLQRRQCSQSSIAVTFNELVTTDFGDSVYIVGDNDALGNWTPANGVPLSASNYSSSYPQWSAPVSLTAGQTIQYKYVRVLASSNQVVWEADPNHSVTLPCDSQVVINDKWQSSSSSTTASSTTSSAIATATTPACTNGPSSRNCWSNGFSIDTDFDKSWPDTGSTVSYNFDITNTTLAPDGTERQVLAINGQYPGPTIYANWGDTISVTVKNSMQNNGTGIHWHGVRQLHSCTADGVSGVTECPLAPGQSTTYTFQATQYGTTWYHSHFSSQYGDGVLGPMVINGPATANYDQDLGPLPITDWYYATVATHAARTMHANALPPEADTALINGSMTSNNGGSYAKTALSTGQRHRVRIINTSVDNHYVVSLDGHTLEVITSDFVPIKPYNTTNIFVGIGQRYDIIVTADQTPAAYWFRADVQDQAGCGSNFNNGNIKSIFYYDGHENDTPSSSETSYSQRCTDEQDLSPYFNSYVPTGQIGSFDTFDVALNQSTAADGFLTLYWQVNGTPMHADWANPTLDHVRNGDTDYGSNANVIELPNESTWLYWVIQGVAGSPYNVQVPHPVHLHGHDFYILGTGSSAWSASDANSLNYVNPTRRDTAMLPSGGYLAIAFQTDNPGAWLLHCHIAWHADEGFAVQFVEAPDQFQSVDSIPSNYDSQCSSWQSFYPNGAAYLQDDSGI